MSSSRAATASSGTTSTPRATRSCAFSTEAGSGHRRGPLPTRSGCAFVGQDGDTVACDQRAGEAKSLRCGLVMEESVAFARDDRIDLEAHLVEQVRLQKALDGREAAVDADSPSGLLLQVGNRVGEIAVEERRATVLTPRHRVQRTRDDEFG